VHRRDFRRLIPETMAIAVPGTFNFDDAVVINGLGVLDNPNLALVHPTMGASALPLSPFGGVDARALRDAKASGLTAFNLTLGPVAGNADPFEATLRDIAGWDDFILSHPLALRKVHGAADITAAKRHGQVGVIYGMQNTTALGDDLDRVQLLARLGVRIIQLTYNVRNAVGDGATVPDDRGLSLFGAQVVERLQAEGVLVDLSHSSERTCVDALAMARRPMVISHSGCRAVANHPRNKSDAELRRLADGGGVIGIYFMPYLRLSGQPHASDLLAHVEHALQICGEDHVGIGTDGGITHFDDPSAHRQRLQADIEQRQAAGIGAPGETAEVGLYLPDLCGVNQFRRLAELLSARGHGDSRIAKILGANLARVTGHAWRWAFSATLQGTTS
jgi:membrane dipeptidase